MAVACVTSDSGFSRSARKPAQATAPRRSGARSMRPQHLALQSSTAIWPGSPQLFVAAAQPAAEYAGSAGVTIVLENEAHDDSGPAASVRAIVEAIGSPHFGTQYDPCNYYHANEEPYPAAYEVVKPYVRYVHLKGGCLYDPVAGPE